MEAKKLTIARRHPSHIAEKQHSSSSLNFFCVQRFPLERVAGRWVVVLHGIGFLETDLLWQNQNHTAVARDPKKLGAYQKEVELQKVLRNERSSELEIGTPDASSRRRALRRAPRRAATSSKPWTSRQFHQSLAAGDEVRDERRRARHGLETNLQHSATPCATGGDEPDADLETNLPDASTRRRAPRRAAASQPRIFETKLPDDRTRLRASRRPPRRAATSQATDCGIVTTSASL